MQNKKLTLTDIESPNNLRHWILEALPKLYNKSSAVTSQHLSIYVNYIKNVINNYENIEKLVWLKAIRELESEIKSIEKME